MEDPPAVSLSRSSLDPAYCFLDIAILTIALPFWQLPMAKANVYDNLQFGRHIMTFVMNHGYFERQFMRNYLLLWEIRRGRESNPYIYLRRHHLVTIR
jgi:hypothetical protein